MVPFWDIPHISGHTLVCLFSLGQGDNEVRILYKYPALLGLHDCKHQSRSGIKVSQHSSHTSTTFFISKYSRLGLTWFFQRISFLAILCMKFFSNFWLNNTFFSIKLLFKWVKLFNCQRLELSGFLILFSRFYCQFVYLKLQNSSIIRIFFWRSQAIRR